MRVVLDVKVIVLQNRSQKFVLGVVDSFNDEAVVTREVEEGSRFARGA